MVTSRPPEQGAGRIVLALAGTALLLALLFAVPTSLGRSLATLPQALAAPTGTAAAGARLAPAGSAGHGASAGAPSGSGAAAAVYAGPVAQTRWGPVQVQLTVQAGRIVDVTALQTPSTNQRDLEINARAVPVLNQRVLQAQNAGIDMVSGATVTSRGYLRSLQAALDQAGL